MLAIAVALPAGRHVPVPLAGARRRRSVAWPGVGRLRPGAAPARARRRRAVRASPSVVAFVVPTPLGGQPRPGSACTPPAPCCWPWCRAPAGDRCAGPAAAVLAVVAGVRRHRSAPGDDPSIERAYYAPADRLPRPRSTPRTGRTEIVPTARHWEAGVRRRALPDRPWLGAPARHPLQPRCSTTTSLTADDVPPTGCSTRASIASPLADAPLDDAGERGGRADRPGAAVPAAGLVATEHWRVWEVVDATGRRRRSGRGRRHRRRHRHARRRAARATSRCASGARRSGAPIRPCASSRPTTGGSCCATSRPAGSRCFMDEADLLTDGDDPCAPS